LQWLQVSEFVRNSDSFLDRGGVISQKEVFTSHFQIFNLVLVGIVAKSFHIGGGDEWYFEVKKIQ
jgi:hypothetical protein